MKQKILSLLFLCSLVLSSSCFPSGQSNKGGRTITVYGFSIMKEALEKEIYPAFAAKWKAENGEEVHFNSSLPVRKPSPIKFCKARPPTLPYFPSSATLTG